MLRKITLGKAVRPNCIQIKVWKCLDGKEIKLLTDMVDNKLKTSKFFIDGD